MVSSYDTQIPNVVPQNGPHCKKHAPKLTIIPSQSICTDTKENPLN